MCCIHKPSVMCAVMFSVYNPGLLNDKRIHTDTLLELGKAVCSRVSSQHLLTAIPSRESKRGKSPEKSLQ